ncbi:MAG: type II toxin-antitoxin system RelE/ParE family toxin [Patescibacteria group bacterium]|nr:type II toxin-antitoxin system RelE/ParE family toxin [Patescibacteria group bacterium]MDE1940734.1 type II toxin-antitoxin system RelE/ParE family toxin [Patescibacteria group bacterium]MDE1966493.1 type II toxin-antitoxin system RelE/ParE family toxin [Patescibacteria group bacterium]
MHVFLHSDAKKKLKKLSPRLREQFDERIALFLREPYHVILNNHSVERAYSGCRSINITGNYRAIYYKEKGSVLIVAIGTHPELYK